MTGVGSMAASPSTEFLDVEGIRLRVSVQGRGRPLLLLRTARWLAAHVGSM